MYSDPFGQKPDRPGPARLPNGSRRSAQLLHGSLRRSAHAARRFRSNLGCRLRGLESQGVTDGCTPHPAWFKRSSRRRCKVRPRHKVLRSGSRDGRTDVLRRSGERAGRSPCDRPGSSERKAVRSGGPPFLFRTNLWCYKRLSGAGTASVRAAREPWGQLAKAA